RKAEIGQAAGGLPRGDRRHENKKVYGEPTGSGVGFMDDLTPCRIKRVPAPVPWFRLDVPMMDCRKARCFSGPPDQKGYGSSDPAGVERLFLWFALHAHLASAASPEM